MALYICDYYSTESGRLPVKEFIDSLDIKTQVKFFSNRKPLLEKHGPRLAYPHAEHLEDGIYELRFKGKKVQKTPRKEIVLAKERRKDFLERLKRGDRR